MLLVVGLSRLLFSVLLGGVSGYPDSDLSYSFNITPFIRPNENLTFVLTTRNSSPSGYFRLSFDVLNQLNNKTVVSVDSKDVGPGGGGKEEVRLEIPRNVSLGPFALRTRSFRVNHPHPPHLEEETLHKLEVDLRKSTILIHLDKPAYEYVQGDTVEFSVVVLDKQRRIFRTEKNVSISIWKTSPEHFLLRRFPQVSIHPGNPLVTGAFQIPHTFYEDPKTKEEFKLLVTVDERSPDDPSRALGFSVPQSVHEMKILDLQEELLFYSYGLVDFSPHPGFPLKLGRVCATPSTRFVTLDDPQVDVEVKVTNPLGLPSTSGHCEFKFSSWAPSTCFTKLNHTVNFTEGRLETRVDLGATFDTDCLRKNVFPTEPSLDLPLHVTCTDNVFGPVYYWDVEEVSLSVGNFLVTHVSVNSPKPSLLFRVTGKDLVPPGSKVTAGTVLEVTYVFHNGSRVNFNESLLECGFAEHVLRGLVDHVDLSHMTAEFKDSGPVRITKCDGCPEKVKSQRSPAMWLTHYNHKRFVPGKSAEVTVVSTSPVTHLHLQFSKEFPGFFQSEDRWETLERVTPSRVSSSRFVTYANVTFPGDAKSVVFLDGDLYLNFMVEPESLPPVEINDAEKSRLFLTPPKAAGGLKVFGISAWPHSTYERNLHTTERSKPISSCAIASKDVAITLGRSRCTASSYVGGSNRVTMDESEITGGGAEDIPVGMRLEEAAGTRWLWNTSSLTSSDSLSIKTSVPDGLTELQDFYGILIDDLHGYRVTRRVTFDPKAPFELFMWPRNSTEPEIQRFTLINKSNKTLTNLTLFQTDLSKRIWFKGAFGEEAFASNTSLPFDVPPYARTDFHTDFGRRSSGLVNFHAVASSDYDRAAVQTKFYVGPPPADYAAMFIAFIDHTNQSESSVNLKIPEDVAQLLEPNTTYHVEVFGTFNFLPDFTSLVLRELQQSHSKLNYPLVAGLLPLHASLGMLTPTSLHVLKNLVTSKLESVNISDLAGAQNSLPLLLQSLFDLYDLQPGVVDLATLSELTDLLLQDLYQEVIQKRIRTPLEIYSRTQTILALQAAWNHRDLIFPNNSSLRHQISSAVAVGTEVILEAASSSAASRLDILAATHLLQQLGNSAAPRIFALASPIISQIVANERSLRERWWLREKEVIEVTLALLIQSKRGNLREAMILARLLDTPSSSHLKYHRLQGFTAFAKASGSGRFVNDGMSLHLQSAVWKGDIGLTITGRGISLAKIYFFEYNEIFNNVSRMK